jgi:hypothetical protein
VEDIQHARVNARIQELLADGRRLAAELDVGSDADGHAVVAFAGRRARLGRWLIGVGTAIAGSERSSDHPAHAA